MAKWQSLLLLLGICLLSACGQYGSLYLPAEKAPSTNQG